MDSNIEELKRQIAQERAEDWTIDPETGRSNSAPLFVDLEVIVERLIRNSAFDLINGRADKVAGLIMAQLAHKYKLRPNDKTQQAVDDELRPTPPPPSEDA